MFNQNSSYLSSQEVAQLLEPQSSRSKRQIKYDKYWPDNLVHFEFDSSVVDQSKYTIRQAIKYIEERTCVKFVEDSKAKDRILFVYESYCSSYIGKHGGVQEVTIGWSCPLMGNYAHEIFHALGITHTMSRYDRDDYLLMNISLFKGGDWVNFMKYTDYDTWNAVPFEYGSAMMYAARPISEPREQVYRETMGNRLITFYDIMAINANYECSCPKDLGCKNGGVPNPSKCDECFCPDGFGGKLCDDAPKRFSRKLMAEKDWSNFTITFGFKGLDELDLKRVVLFIEAPKNKTIQVQVTKIENFACSDKCIYNGYEVKHMGDPRIMNPLFCCETQPLWNNTWTSKLNPTPVILYTRYDQQTIAIRYRFIDQNLADLPRKNNIYDSFEYPI
ncbi:hypothetical protein CAEBREN_26249 [Caenorhabditis brenneri]|uniref:Zinc metalloproteinase n=1 Tax=Caenorhabditis brenneri TaxID=135651 RepID=G0NIS4_CAEBE|nr:hypothetical protein CAEBREN_26249 [Caenorhabditis brenneri]